MKPSPNHRYKRCRRSSKRSSSCLPATSRKLSRGHPETSHLKLLAIQEAFHQERPPGPPGAKVNPKSRSHPTEMVSGNARGLEPGAFRNRQACRRPRHQTRDRWERASSQWHSPTLDHRVTPRLRSKGHPTHQPARKLPQEKRKKKTILNIIFLIGIHS